MWEWDVIVLIFDHYLSSLSSLRKGNLRRAETFCILRTYLPDLSKVLI